MVIVIQLNLVQLGRAGEAYFVEEVEGPPSAGDYLASPITSPPSSPRGGRRGEELVSFAGAPVTLAAAAAGVQTGLAVSVDEKNGKLASGGSGKNEKSVAPSAAAPKQGSRWRSLFSWRSKPPPPSSGNLTLSQSTPVLPDPNDLAPRMPRVPRYLLLLTNMSHSAHMQTYIYYAMA